MIAQATCDATGVIIYETHEQENDSVKPGEVLMLIPQGQEENGFTVPINPWQGNGS